MIAGVTVTVLKHNGPGTPVYGLIPTGTTPQADGQQITTAFLKAWQSGNLTEAANYTNHPAAARAALATYAKYLDLGKMTATTGSVVGAPGSTAAAPSETAKFAVDASVAAKDGAKVIRGMWGYNSTLTAYQQANSSIWFIKWQPDVVAPNLTTTTRLAAIAVAPTVGLVTDASGEGLTTFGDAGLSTISSDLSKFPPSAEGKPGLDVQIETTKGKPVTDSQAIVIAPDNIPSITTTITTADETAARAAVAMHPMSSMVVIQPSTGDILAVANNDGFNDFALTAAVAPGSSMKVITSTALFNAGLLTPQSAVTCPPTYTIQGITYHNDQNESEPAGTPFIDDFAQSCNNAFTTQEPYLYGKLASTAKDYYGLDQDWDIGIGDLSASYFNAPATASGSELAQEAFGEGQLTASPIAMASVAATVDYGSFKQPILVAGIKQATATPLPASTDTYMKELMRAVVTEGTADGIGFGPDVYAKTGTADIKGQEQPNSWLIAFDPDDDVAVACLVLNAGVWRSVRLARRSRPSSTPPDAWPQLVGAEGEQPRDVALAGLGEGGDRHPVREQRRGVRAERAVHAGEGHRHSVVLDVVGVASRLQVGLGHLERRGVHGGGSCAELNGCTIARHSRPPGRSTRPISRTAPGKSSMSSSDMHARTRAAHPSATGSLAASASSTGSRGVSADAAAASVGDRSTPITRR